MCKLELFGLRMFYFLDIYFYLIKIINRNVNKLKGSLYY